jgi:hypothetical protein
MDSLITAAALAFFAHSTGLPLRREPPALALRGIAMVSNRCGSDVDLVGPQTAQALLGFPRSELPCQLVPPMGLLGIRLDPAHVEAC